MITLYRKAPQRLRGAKSVLTSGGTCKCRIESPNKLFMVNNKWTAALLHFEKWIRMISSYDRKYQTNA